MNNHIADSIFVIPGMLRAEEFSGSLLWQIAGNGLTAPSYILGTHHLASDVFAQQMPGLERALNEVEQVVGEIEVADMADVRAEIDEYTYLPDGCDYSQLVTPEEYHTLDNGLREVLGSGLDRYGRHHPAILAMMYASAISREAIPAEYRGQVGIDQYVQDEARRRGKRVIGLETTQEQIDVALNTEDIGTMASMLAEVVSHNAYNRRAAANLFNLYVNNNLCEVYTESLSSSGDPYGMSARYQAALNKERNDRWLALLPDIIAQAPTLIAVGALHLCGEEGLLARLAAIGYAVEPVR